MRYTKKEIMDARRYERALVELSKRAAVLKEQRDYDAWKKEVDHRIAAINARIRTAKA